MTFVRSLLRDLVERRLWPVALLLVAGIVAVPVVLGGGSDASAPVAPPAAAPATAADTATAEKAEVTLDDEVPADRDRPGAVRNPFKAPASARPKAAGPSASASSAAGSAAPSASTASAGSAGTGSAGSGSTGAATSGGRPSTGASTATPQAATPKANATTKPKTAATPTAEDAQDTYHVDINLAVKGGPSKTLKDVARLSALPSVSDPFFVYLGVIETKAHEKRAVFLISSDATPNGEGACHPTKGDCESVELAVGQTAWFDLTAPDGTPTQYELGLTALHRTAVRTPAKARAAIARHSNAGAELLRDAAVRNVRAAAGARAYRYVPALGQLVRSRRQGQVARAAAGGTAAEPAEAIALLPRQQQPGLPVWHSPAAGAGR